MFEKERKFSGVISVRFGTKRFKLELCPAELQGGPAGLFRVRVNRRWHDGPGGWPIFMGREQVAALAASLASAGVLPALPPLPDIPAGSRVSVKFWYYSNPYSNSTVTSTPPIRGYDGKIYIGIVTYEAGFIWAPLENINVLKLNHHRVRRTNLEEMAEYE